MCRNYGSFSKRTDSIVKLDQSDMNKDVSTESAAPTTFEIIYLKGSGQTITVCLPESALFGANAVFEVEDIPWEEVISDRGDGEEHLSENGTVSQGNAKSVGVWM